MIKDCLTVVLLAATLTAAGCGGGGGGGDNATTITGLCETCDSDVDCEAGLKCQECLSGCTGEVRRCVGLDDESDRRLQCDGGSYPAGCVNIAGTWTATEELNGQCFIAGDDIPLEQSGTATVFFNQNGCDVSYTVPQVGDRTGTIVGNRMRLEGPFLVVIDDSVAIAFTENRAMLEGTVDGNHMSLMGEGRARGVVEGEDLTCNGMSVADAHR